MLAVMKSDEPVKTYNEIIDAIENSLSPDTSSIDDHPLRDWYRAQ